jgi:cell division protein FtsB
VSVDAGAVRQRQARQRTTSRPAATRRIAPTAAALLALCALLLVGVVFVQIAVIRQNMDRSDLENRAATVSAQSRDLETQIQKAQSSPTVDAQARRIGMVPAPAALAHPLTGRPLTGG